MKPLPAKPEHADLPPSSSDKWIECHAWFRYTRGIKDEGSAAADEGTAAHLVLAKVLGGETKISSIDNEELADAIGVCMDWISDQVGEIFSEVEVDFGAKFGFVDLFGTSDLVILGDDLLTISDFKYGRGLVEVPGNTQLMTYLSGAVAKFGRRPRYRIGIMQPRAYHPDGFVREAYVSQEDLDAFEERMAAAILANYNRGPAKVGDHCRNFCSALGSCPAVAAHSVKLFRSTPV